MLPIVKREQRKNVLLCSPSIQALDHRPHECVCVCVCVCALAYMLLVCGLNTALYCCPNHCAPKGTSKVIKVTLFCRSKHRPALYFVTVFHRRLCLDVSQQWICIQLLFAHEMSTLGNIFVINTCALATMSVL